MGNAAHAAALIFLSEAQPDGCACLAKKKGAGRVVTKNGQDAFIENQKEVKQISVFRSTDEATPNAAAKIARLTGANGEGAGRYNRRDSAKFRDRRVFRLPP